MLSFSFSLSMASSSTVLTLAAMDELHAHGLGVSILVPIGKDGFASVSTLHLSIRFSLQMSTIWVEREIFDPSTSLLSVTMRENSKLAENGSMI